MTTQGSGGLGAAPPLGSCLPLRCLLRNLIPHLSTLTDLEFLHCDQLASDLVTSLHHHTVRAAGRTNRSGKETGDESARLHGQQQLHSTIARQSFCFLENDRSSIVCVVADPSPMVPMSS